jgi:hypothetical protein
MASSTAASLATPVIFRMLKNIEQLFFTDLRADIAGSPAAKRLSHRFEQALSMYANISRDNISSGPPGSSSSISFARGNRCQGY